MAPHPVLLRWLKERTESIDPSGLETAADWQRVLESATQHGLVPLLHRTVTRLPDRRIPQQMRDALRQITAHTAARNLLLLSELVQITERFRRAAIQLIPLRGVVLSEQLYGDVTIRPTGDLDLLVRRWELPAVREHLSALGFREVEPRPGFAEDYYYTLEFIKEHHMTVIVEPHWSIGYPPFLHRIPMNAIWSRAVNGSVGPLQRVDLLGSEDLFLHLCLHIMHHAEDAPVLWLYELDRLLHLAGARFNWTLVTSVVREAQLEPLVCPVLTMLRTMFATAIPVSVLGQLERIMPHQRGRNAMTLLTAADVRGREKIATLLEMNGFRAKCRYAISFLFPSAAFIRTQYGASSRLQVVLTYLWRSCSLSWQGLKTIARLTFHPRFL